MMGSPASSAGGSPRTPLPPHLKPSLREKFTRTILPNTPKAVYKHIGLAPIVMIEKIQESVSETSPLSFFEWLKENPLGDEAQ